MMKFKKFLAAAMTGAMMFSTVAVAVPAVHVLADTVAPSAYTAVINYNNFTVTISSATKNDPYVTLEVGKDEKFTKAGTKYTYAMPESNTLVVDLSFLNVSKKAAYIRVYGSSEDAASGAIKTINPQAEKFSMKYTPGQKASEWYKAFKIGKSDATKADDLSGYEFRSLYGSTDFVDLTYEALNPAVAEVAGTTILVRKEADNTNQDETKRHPASAEAKVKIAAAPKAPKVTIDYAKGTIKLPKNAWIEVLYANENGGETTSALELEKNAQLYVEEETATRELIDASNVEDYFEVVEGDGSTTQDTIQATDDYSFYDAEEIAEGDEPLAVEDLVNDGYLTIEGNTGAKVPAVTTSSLYVAKVTTSRVPITTSDLDDYFTIKNGAPVPINENNVFYSNLEETEGEEQIEDFINYITVKPTTTSSTNSTTMKEYTGENTVDREALLKAALGENATNIQSIIDNGFTLVVCTKAAKKAMSNPTIVTIKEGSNLTKGTNSVQLDASTSLSWKEETKKGTAGFTLEIKGSFEYKDSKGWKKLKDGAFFASGTELEVRVAGVKDKDETKCKLPSNSKIIKLTKVELTATPSSKTIYTDNTGLPTIEVKSGTTPVPAAKIAWTVTKGEGDSAEETDDLSVDETGLVKVKNGTTLTAETVYILTGKVTDGDFKDKTVTVKLTVETAQAVEDPDPSQ